MVLDLVLYIRRSMYRIRRYLDGRVVELYRSSTLLLTGLSDTPHYLIDPISHAVKGTMVLEAEADDDYPNRPLWLAAWQ